MDRLAVEHWNSLPVSGEMFLLRVVQMTILACAATWVSVLVIRDRQGKASRELDRLRAQHD